MCLFQLDKICLSLSGPFLNKKDINCRPPQPPPRVKRPSVTASGTHRVGPTPIQRPTAPPPAVPATLEIGEPTSVTINGVTVSKKSPESLAEEGYQAQESHQVEELQGHDVKVKT